MGRDVTLEFDSRGRTTVPAPDRKALGIMGKSGLLDAEVEVLEVENNPCSWTVDDLPDVVLDIMDESQISALQDALPAENPGDRDGN